MKKVIIHFRDGSSEDELSPALEILISNGLHRYDISDSPDSAYHIDTIESIEIVEIEDHG